MELFKNIAHYCLPGNCLLCHYKTHSICNICNDCYSHLPLAEHFCLRCGNALPIHQRDYCGECLKNPPFFDKTHILFHYTSPIQELIQKFKFNHQLLYGNSLANLFANVLNKNVMKKPDCIVPMPLHKKRLRERGYNQALIISEVLKKRLNIEIDTHQWQRQKATRPQAELPTKERTQNTKNAFLFTGVKPPNHIAIVDDIMTTGNTANALAKCMRNAGVQFIEVWCLARPNLIS